DAFTAELAKIGVPTVASKAKFQQKVANLNVISNVEGIVTGAGLKGGNIEFWPHNYGPPNSAAIPNASSELWDFGDEIALPEDGYGSMQVHNHEAKQTIFALNSWKGGLKADLGIGNSTGQTRDWTFMRNADTYSLKKLRVLVRPKK
ncbi:MAG: 9-O-acetylesterase, partial [Planctomycetes bacterium]|nr:9-O-acetylesterase [Planctomycetota bacterium]